MNTGCEVAECQDHKDRCKFGRDHNWGICWYDANGTWHTSMICSTCQRTCIAELVYDGEACSCGGDCSKAPSPWGSRTL